MLALPGGLAGVGCALEGLQPLAGGFGIADAMDWVMKLRIWSRLLATAVAVFAATAASTVLAADPFGVALPMAQQPSGNYYITATLSGTVRTDLLVDTGSGYVSLSPATFARLKSLPGTEFQRIIVGSMANGHALKVQVYRVQQLALGEHCVLRDVEVAVMPGASRDILGLSALRRVAPFALDLERGELRLSRCEAALAASH